MSRTDIRTFLENNINPRSVYARSIDEAESFITYVRDDIVRKKRAFENNSLKITSSCSTDLLLFIGIVYEFFIPEYQLYTIGFQETDFGPEITILVKKDVPRTSEDQIAVWAEVARAKMDRLNATSKEDKEVFFRKIRQTILEANWTSNSITMTYDWNNISANDVKLVLDRFSHKFSMKVIDGVLHITLN